MIPNDVSVRGFGQESFRGHGQADVPGVELGRNDDSVEQALASHLGHHGARQLGEFGAQNCS